MAALGSGSPPGWVCVRHRPTPPLYSWGRQREGDFVGESHAPPTGETRGLSLTPEGGWRGARASLTFQA